MPRLFRAPLRLALVGALASLLASPACYTLNGISITPETETFFVEQFDVVTIEGPQEMGQRFTELLKERINRDTRLIFSETDPDVEFAGAVADFSVTPEAPNAENRSDLNRLTVRISVDYVDRVTEKNSYRQAFTDYELFDASQDLLSVQDDLVETLFARMSEDVFNKAFSNW